MGITLPKTKIICTLGPASETPEVIRELISNGMSVARLNFSHGTLGEHEQKIQIIRRISMEMDKPVAILQDPDLVDRLRTLGGCGYRKVVCLGKLVGKPMQVTPK